MQWEADMAENNVNLIAYCGLYCGSCKAYINKKCPGCAKNEKASWCQIRKCCISGSLSNCSVCVSFDDVKKCKKFNNFISKIFALVFKSDRFACLAKIKELGAAGYAQYMSENNLQSIKKGSKK
jgi:hypothetical protein